MRSCWSYKKNLVDLTMRADENQEFYNFLYEWATDQAAKLSYNQANQMPKFDNSFWTSGKFVESYKDPQLRWETDSSFFNIDTDGKLIEWNWAPKEPMDPTDDKLKMERCLSIGITNWNENKDNVKPVMSVDHCLLPRFYICYQDIELGLNNGEIRASSEEVSGVNEFFKNRHLTTAAEEPIIGK